MQHLISCWSIWVLPLHSMVFLENDLQLISVEGGFLIIISEASSIRSNPFLFIILQQSEVKSACCHLHLY